MMKLQISCGCSTVLLSSENKKSTKIKTTDLVFYYMNFTKKNNHWLSQLVCAYAIIIVMKPNLLKGIDIKAQLK